jgi:hypothetical protein
MSVFRKFLAGAVALPLVIGLSAAAHAQDKPDSAAKPDADALAALSKMGEALRALNAFTLTADVTTEQVLDSGQKLQYSGDLKIEAQRPSGFKIYMALDHREREIYYDGSRSPCSRPRSATTPRSPRPPRSAPPSRRSRTSTASRSRWPTCSSWASILP